MQTQEDIDRIRDLKEYLDRINEKEAASLFSGTAAKPVEEDKSITVEEIRQLAKNVSPGRHLPSNPYMLEPLGMPICEAPKPPPKIKLRASVDVSDEFRREFDAWLLEQFGYCDPLLGPDQVLFSRQYGMVITPPGMSALLAKATA